MTTTYTHKTEAGVYVTIEVESLNAWGGRPVDDAGNQLPPQIRHERRFVADQTICGMRYRWNPSAKMWEVQP
jgi:hypothetical protein